MNCSYITCASRNATFTSLQKRSGNTAYVMLKGHVTDVMVISGEEVALQPSAGKRNVD